MSFIKYSSVLILILLAIRGSLQAPLGRNEVEDEDNSSLADVVDVDIEQEERRRWIGGPWSAEEAVSIFNVGLDLLRDPNRTKRKRRFEIEAKQLIQIITGIDDAKVEQPEVVGDDEEWDDGPEIVNGHVVEPKTQKLILDMLDGTNGQFKRSQASIQKLYSWYHPELASRWRKRIGSGGNRKDKLQALDQHVYGIFKDARDKRYPIHGRMIQRWARQYANITSGLEDFKASDSWLYRFKRRHRVVSRKVTLYTSRAEVERNQTIVEAIHNFTSNYSRECIPFDRSSIWNFDQTGFNYEPSNLRTLSFKGERDTALMLGSKNKHTHSYTAQPMISRAGKLFPKLLLVMQEDGDAFGPRIAPNIKRLEERYGNVEVFASKSGKLTSYHVDKWFRTTLKNLVDNTKRSRAIEDEAAILVLADSWSGHSKGTQITDLKRIGAKLLRIPPHTTDKIQPLDVNYNRQLKIFYNRIVEESFYQDKIQEVTSREGIINLHSLIHNQFMSPKYRDMILFAWRNTDPSFDPSELEHNPPKMVNSIQFEFDDGVKCARAGCGEHAFLRCSHCGKPLCLHHFLERECFHTVSRAKRDTSDTCQTSDADTCEPDDEKLEEEVPEASPGVSQDTPFVVTESDIHRIMDPQRAEAFPGGGRALAEGATALIARSGLLSRKPRPGDSYRRETPLDTEDPSLPDPQTDVESTRRPTTGSTTTTRPKRTRRPKNPRRPRPRIRG